MQSNSAHLDTFARDHLPPQEEWPELRFDLPELRFPPQVNCATAVTFWQRGTGGRRGGVGMIWGSLQAAVHVWQPMQRRRSATMT